MSGVPTLWRAMEALPAGAALLTRVLTYLDTVSLVSLLQVEKRSRNSARKLFAASQRARARLALASLCFSRLRVEFQAYYQVLETHNIPRSSDPRVPPRVVSLWTERGQVDGGSVTLKPNELPSVHKDGVTIRFVSDLNAAGKRPMLSNVVQRNRRIYTMVTVKLLRSNSAGENRGSATGDGLVLRSYSYLKEFGEWKTPTLPEKRMLAAASVGSRHGRFDLCSQDGSVILELEVPTGTDAQTDYFLVKQATVSIHMQELLQQHFHSLRPIRSLPEPTRRESCSISITFRSMTGGLVAKCCTPGYITVEQQNGEDEAAQASEDRPRQRTGIEKFEIVTCRTDSDSDRSVKIALPTDPGYAWIEVRGTDEGTPSRSSMYFYAVALHYGSRLVPGQSDSRVVQLNWLPGVLESFPTLESRHRRCLKGNLRMVTSSHAGTLQELTLVAQRLPAARLERYAARIESYTRHEA
ncbi:hypothetical protein PF005_g10543 [Phytophthora fragariae]|uniref:Uncharacterized protein n=1 Tax=Phytophthora fragariae TaxID=53985 RepID=A0A6A3KTP9_9STRA|nr:hypothetical protein PF003_g29505 [Phytophthora fragariae]KAE8938463.1 hypothetical protein PF009_g11675 [Phytophthora fragariae]KAE9010876.1 hypothetical protein PF011_g9611 [Phytophthora fragariae]KAE9112835.1 hypothetical protein PF007_g10965 [Phytophthora fragariae]KAE9113118.1 hypothetical protein PF010_g10211 [Phytophthora fragariae]